MRRRDSQPAAIEPPSPQFPAVRSCDSRSVDSRGCEYSSTDDAETGGERFYRVRLNQ